MQLSTFIGVVLALVAVLEAILLGVMVAKWRKFSKITNGGQLLADIQAFDDAGSIEDQQVMLVASCERFRRAQMLWINESQERFPELDAAESQMRRDRAAQLATAWGEVYVLSAGFYRRWKMRE